MSEGGADLTTLSIVCTSTSVTTTNGIWQGDDPLKFSLPLFILQLTLVILTTRALYFILRPLRQPHVVAEIIGGVLLGPSVLGKLPLGKKLFPSWSVMALETMANIGLLYFLFLVGVEMDISMIRRTGRKSLMLAVAGMAIPFFISTIAFFFLKPAMAADVHQSSFLLFLGVAISITAFPVLARILAELKLLNTELGRLAMSAAIVNDMFAWTLLTLALAVSGNRNSMLSSLLVILSSAAFIAFSLFLLQPAIKWMLRRTPEGEPVSDIQICVLLTGVMVCGVVTDAIGIHSIFGAFIFGLIIPNGPVGTVLVDKLEDFVSGLLLPLFFAISGLRTDIRKMSSSGQGWGFLLFTVIMASAGKVAGTMLITGFYRMPIRESLSLGVLLNTKGLIGIMVLNIGRDQKVLDDHSFAILVFMALVMTCTVTPVVTMVYKPSRPNVAYKRRTIERSKADGELCFVACLHGPRNVPAMLNLVEASQPTKKSPIFLYALHLVELTGRSAAMLIVHNTRRIGRPTLSRTQAHSDHIVAALEHFEKSTPSVSVQPLTAISPYSTMHEDICALALDKRAVLIILPFHKELTVDGAMEATNPAFRAVNQNVLFFAPCSVAILIDRGLGATGAFRHHSDTTSRRVAVLFFGGPDDREALCYAARMAKCRGCFLTVVRFLPGSDVIQVPNMLAVATEKQERELRLDNTLIDEFRYGRLNDETAEYMERVVNNGEETITAVRELSGSSKLFIVGRSQDVASSLTAGLNDWSECPELGAIGDVLASSDFSPTASVLVIQQYVGGEVAEVEPESPGGHGEKYLNTSDGQQGLLGPPAGQQREEASTPTRRHSSFSNKDNWDNSKPVAT